MTCEEIRIALEQVRQSNMNTSESEISMNRFGLARLKKNQPTSGQSGPDPTCGSLLKN